MTIWEWDSVKRAEPIDVTLPNGFLYALQKSEHPEHRDTFIVMLPNRDLVIGPALEAEDRYSLAIAWRLFRYDMVYLRCAMREGTMTLPYRSTEVGVPMEVTK